MSDVYVLTAFYSDRSACYLIGVYEDPREATDRLHVAKAVRSEMEVRVHRMPLGYVSLTDICAFTAFDAKPNG